MLPKSRRRSTDTTRVSARTPMARRASGGAASTLDSYWARSMRPLHVLVFLLPLILLYELGSFLFLRDISGKEVSVVAYRLFLDFFNAFGLAGVSLPSLALVVVLLAWHLMVKDRWKVDFNTLGGMLLESLMWTMPLLVLAATVHHAQDTLHTGGPPLAQGTTARPTADLPPMAGLTIAVGAGLYEEMLFRLIGIALLHFILVDLIGLVNRWANPIAVVLAALAFAAYHQHQSFQEFVFRVLAGVIFGTIYLMRGFGIVAATHALYDILVIVILSHF